jgi:hypothetical protein
MRRLFLAALTVSALTIPASAIAAPLDGWWQHYFSRLELCLRTVGNGNQVYVPCWA